MLHRILTAALLLSATATLSAQSSLSFETYDDTSSSANSGSSSGYMAAGDFNNDGKPDLIECCNSSMQMLFRAGNGDGTFQAPVVAWSTPVGLSSLAAVDVNGDGKLDLVGIATPNPPSGKGGGGSYYLMVWLGNGNGTFQNPRKYTTTNFPLHSFTGNFFGDGRTDVAVLDDQGYFELFRNEGNGTFAFDTSVNTGGYPAQGIAGDFNGNGVTDLALLHQTSATNGAAPWDLLILWNDGKGDFTQQNLGGNYSSPGIAVGRLNGAAATDILVSYSCTPAAGDKYCVGFDGYYGQGNNTVYKRSLVQDSSGVNYGTLGQLAGVDVNGDGYGDIEAIGALQCNATTGACPITSPFGLFVWEGNADGSFRQTPREFIASQGYTLGSAVMADFNRDGMMDFAQAIFTGGGGTEVYINSTTRSGCGKYTISPTVTVCEPVDGTYSTSPVRVDANSYDTTPVTDMQEYADNSLEYTEPVSSFNETFPVNEGSQSFVTKAWDKSGHSFVADRTVTVYSGTPGPVCSADENSASICLPSGDTSSSPVSILANGNTGNSLPTAAQLYIDGKQTVDNKTPCNSDDDCYGAVTFVRATEALSPGTHDLVFKIWDMTGKVYEAQKTVTVN